MAYIGVSPSNGVRQKHTYTATASQTTFSGAGSEGVSLSYRDSNYVDVYRNGVKLGDADYTATSGTSIVLGEGAAVNDIVEIVTYDVFSVADTVSKADGGTFDGNVTMAGTLAVTGETTLSTHLNMGDNDIIKLGAGADLQIYHNGSNSYVEDTGDGNLTLLGTNLRLGNTGHTQNYFAGTDNGASTIYYAGSAKLATKTDGVDITGELQADSLDIDGDADISGSLTMGGNINLQDNDALRIGTGADLRLYHDGSDSYIDDIGTGDLYIRANDQLRLQKYTGENMIVGNVDGAVQLYHNNVEKFATTSYGIDISGSVVADTQTAGTVTGTTTADFNTYQNFVWTLTGNVTLDNPSTEKVGQSGFITFIQDGTGGRTVSLGTDYETAGGAGLTLSSAASATDVVPYIVVASGRVLLGTPQLAFS